VRLELEVENTRCGGCARTIEKRLRADPRVTAVHVEPGRGLVSIETSAEMREEASAMLAHLGYPPRGSVEGLKAAAAKAKSIVSCAVGKVSRS
jgi:copper chaperone